MLRFGVSLELMLLCALAVQVGCRADTVFLKNGAQIEGTVVEDGALLVVIKTSKGTLVNVRQADVDVVVREPLKPAARAAAPQPGPSKGVPPAQTLLPSGKPKGVEDAEKPLKDKNAPVANSEIDSTGPVWLESWDKAVEAAKATNKIILADFTGGDWCGWCQKLDREVFSTREFADWAQRNVVLLKLEYPRKKAQDAALKKQNTALAQKYGIRGYPTVKFLDPQGNELGSSGYLPGGPKAWIKSADKFIKG